VVGVAGFMPNQGLEEEKQDGSQDDGKQEFSDSERRLLGFLFVFVHDLSPVGGPLQGKYNAVLYLNGSPLGVI
jgi:hypothetical protein